MKTLAERYHRIQASLPPGVKLIAVSKTRSVEEIRALYDLGHRAFGENYPQELKEKQPVLPADIEWHFIGHLQRSNVKHIIAFTHLVHGVDSLPLLDELNKRAGTVGRSIDVLLQIHIAKEESKHGFSSEEIRTFFQQPDISHRWPNVRVRGLMGMATNTEDRTLVSSEFAGLAGLFREIRETGPYPTDQFCELSMGMTSDADIAVAQGSTMVRIGTAIFGDRS